MILELINITDPRLRKKSKKVDKIDKKVKRLIADMKETLEIQNDPEGVGLAAAQVGKNVQIFIMKPEEELVVIINPEVISKSKVTKKQLKGKTEVMEGCLSLPHYYGPLHRSKEVTLRYMNEAGHDITKIFKGFTAQIILHEIDHIEGILFVDRMLEQKQPLYEHKDGQWHDVDLT